MCSSSEFWKTRLSGLIIYLLHRINSSKVELLSTASKSNWASYWYLYVRLMKILKIRCITEMKGTQIQRRCSLFWFQPMYPSVTLCTPVSKPAVGPRAIQLQAAVFPIHHPLATASPMACPAEATSEQSSPSGGWAFSLPQRAETMHRHPTSFHNSERGRSYSVLFI